MCACNVLKKKTIAVFICLTSYHTFVSYAYADYLYKKYGIVSRFLLYGVPDIKNVCVDYIEFYYLDKRENTLIDLIKKRVIYAGYLFKFSKIKSIVSAREKILLFVYNDLNPVSYKIMRLVKKYSLENMVVIVDEGLAIYTDTKIDLHLNLKFRIREFILKYLFGSPSHYKAIGDDERVDFVIVGDVELYKTLKKAENKGVIKQNKKSLFSADFIEDYMSTFFNIELDKTECSILVVGQNYSGKGSITEQEEVLLKEVGEIFDNIGKTIIKPHPTDNTDKYNNIVNKFNNLSVIDPQLSKIPMECIFGYFNSDYLVTLNSSAALNIASCFPEKKVIFLVDYQLSKSNRKPVKERLACTNPMHSLNFYSAIEKVKNVYIPSDKNELAMMLKKGKTESLNHNTVLNEQIGYYEIDCLLRYWRKN